MESMSSSRPTWRLFLRTAMPTVGSITGAFVATIFIVGGHLLLLSQDAGLLLPTFAGTSNDQLAEVYTNTILGPLNRAFGNNTLGALSTALLWGFVGWAVYAVVDFLVVRAKELKSSDKEIATPLQNQVIYHPMHRQIVIRLLWRFLMGMVLLVVTLLLQPVVSNLFHQDVLLLKSADSIEMLKHAGIVLVGWIAIFQLYVVLFRLFVLRTRVFGEILY